MIRLTCSNDRQGLDALERKLSGAGISSEVRENPLKAMLGITRFEVFVHEEDWPVASRLCQGPATLEVEADAPNESRDAWRFTNPVKSAASELVIEAKVLPASETEAQRDDDLDRPPGNGETRLENDLAQATALLKEEVEALLAREVKLIDRCSSLEEKVKTLDEALAKARAELGREAANRSSAEKKLAEVTEVRSSLEKDLHALELRLKASEQALATSKSQLEMQARQREQVIKELRQEKVQMQAYVGTVNDLRTKVRARLAAKEEPGPSLPEQRTRRPVGEKQRTTMRQGGS